MVGAPRIRMVFRK